MLGGSFGGIQSYSEKQGNIKSYKKKENFSLYYLCPLKTVLRKRFRKEFLLFGGIFGAIKKLYEKQRNKTIRLDLG